MFYTVASGFSVKLYEKKKKKRGNWIFPSYHVRVFRAIVKGLKR